MKGYIIGVIVGAACMAGGVIMARGSQPEYPCLDIIVVAELVDGCMAGNREVCDLLDDTVPASCLIQRAEEATDARRMRFGRNSMEGVTL